MNEQEKQKYLEQYDKDKKKGVPFFPDIIFKDVVVVFIVFLILIALSYFVGVPVEERANPSDANYTPRPEWYFMFLFQLLKYFPGELEVIGVVVLPTIGVILLLALPFLDKKPQRHFMNRRRVLVGTSLGVFSVGLLTVLSMIEAPPPSAEATGDSTAALYTNNCAVCHGSTINVPSGLNLHEIIAQGNHESMPAWNADLSADQIDALVGFILSPAGSVLFDQHCGECHEALDLVETQPLQLKSALEEGNGFEAHEEVNIPLWSETLSAAERTALINFLVAPDGQRLFVTNCASCHGSSVATNATREQIFETILAGGEHLEMPAWQDVLSGAEIEALADYIEDPAANANTLTLYEANCLSCHAGQVPRSADRATGVEIIATGGSHQTMPVWGDVLTEEQVDALVSYTYDAAQGVSSNVGQNLYNANCVSCHGLFGEGGPNPGLAGDVIAPISTTEYLSTRDDVTLRLIISGGQPNFGMSPFGLSNGGPLDESEIDALITYLRSWEDNPPVDLPPEVSVSSVTLSGGEIFKAICAQCHGDDASGVEGVGTSLRSTNFRSTNSADDIFNTINLGHEATSMISWGEVLSAEQIQELVKFILSVPEGEGGGEGVSFALSVLPVFEARCSFCHDDERVDGGWNSTSYANVVETGDNSPVIIPGDVDNSLLAQKLLDLQEEGDKMPTVGEMPADALQIILDWIAEGAKDN